MSRPKKCRIICSMPENMAFFPERKCCGEKVNLLLEEFEAVRLIDLEGYSQYESSQFMGVSRTTVQEIYDSARKKIALSLVMGYPIEISGGSYVLCNGCMRNKSNFKEGDVNMIIAVTYNNGEIFQHFGHTEYFKLYTVEDGKVVKTDVVSTNGSGHGALAEFLLNNNVNVLICGGIGAGAQKILAESGIKLYGGVMGDADKAVEDLLKDNLNFNPDVKCSHHDHEHHHEHGEGHSCHHGNC